jgi:hypothetical protein
MKHFLLFTTYCLFVMAAVAQGPVWINTRSLKVCDTIQFEWDGTTIGKGYKLASLHVWVDDINGGTRWKYRYPIINGKASGSLEIPATMKPGAYAFNFMGSETYLEMKGQVKKIRIKTARNHKTGKMDTILTQEAPGWVGQDIKYNLMSRQGVLFDSTLQVNADGAFRLPPIVFGDTANLNFKPEKTSDRYYIFLETPLDSAFTPFHTQTVFVTVKQQEYLSADTVVADSTRYSFALEDAYRDAITLDEVFLTGKSKADKFEKQYVSPQFKNAMDGKTFDGLDPDSELSRATNIFTFLQAYVPGLQLRNDLITVTALWRNDPVTFFLDEIRIDPASLRLMPPSDIAMIKTYPAPATMTSFVFGGAIAIYTKRGEYNPINGPRYSFVINGYTQGETAMK